MEIKKDNKPLVTISIPSYNGIDFLKNCSIPSILNQTYGNFEAFIINDGPDRAVENLIKSLNDNRFKYLDYPKVNYHSKHETWCLGGTTGQNIALDMCSGDYISHLDQDDLWAPFFLSYKVNYLNSNKEIDFVHSNCIWSSGNIIFGTNYNGSKTKNTMSHHTVMYRSFLKKYKYTTTGSVPADFDRWQRMYDDGVKMKYLKITDSIYNKKTESFSQIRDLYFRFFGKKIIPIK